MARKNAHFQKKEPVLEHFLSYLRFRKIIKMIPENSEVLDLGCGYNGKLLKKISGKIKEGTGLDLSVNQETKISNLKLLKCDLNKSFPFEEEMFDVTISLALLEHLDNYKNHLSESFRVLKNDGLLLLTTPAPKSRNLLEFLVKMGLLSKREIEDHKKYFYLEELKNFAKDAGFSEIKCKKFQFGFNNLLIAKK